MTRIIHLNGTLVPENEAKISVFDRAVTFADSIYEGFGILDGNIVDYTGHHTRLLHSLHETEIPWKQSRDETFHMLRRLISANKVDEGFLYLQISRGTEERDYVPCDGLTPTVIAYTQPVSPSRADQLPAARVLYSVPDLRWARRDVKSTNLLGQVMAKTAAQKAGAQEALMIDPRGYVTEGGATSFFAILKDTIVIRPLSTAILNGITRKTISELADRDGLKVQERLMSLEEAYSADEAFITAASLNVCPVIDIDGHEIGNGRPGPITTALHKAYVANARASFYEPQDI